MLCIFLDQTVWIKKALNCFCKRNPVFLQILGFFGIVPFKFHQPRGFEGWLNRLQQQSPDDSEFETLDATQPLDDITKMRWLLAVDRRYTHTFVRARPGLANERVLEDLIAIASDSSPISSNRSTD